MRCEFIKAHGGEFGPIGKACEILRVSKSEYYDCLNRPKSNAQTEREALGGFVVGWSMSDRIAEKLAIDALEQAVGREDPPDDFSLVFHDDQGSQCTSRAFQRCLESHGIAQSMSRPGNPWDDAVAESFFKTLKRELVKERSYGTRDEARQDIFKYIELYYNRVRMHSTLGYMSPVEYERQYA